MDLDLEAVRYLSHPSSPRSGLTPDVSRVELLHKCEMAAVAARLQRHALALDLRNPRSGALLGHLRLVVLVAREANELAAVDRLGLLVVVAVRRPGANNLGALGLEAAGQLVH